MKKFAISIATLTIALSACGDVNEDTQNNNQNNENQEVEEEPDANLANNNEENDPGLDDEENNEFSVDNDNTDVTSDEETEAVMNQNIENFDLNVTLVDDSDWNFNYSPSEGEDGQAEATVSGDDIDLEGEQAIEEMETYLSNFHVDAASEQNEIKTEIAETFEFNEDDIQQYNLTINFAEHEDDTEWNWSQDEDDGEQENNDDNNDNNLELDDFGGNNNNNNN